MILVYSPRVKVSSGVSTSVSTLAPTPSLSDIFNSSSKCKSFNSCSKSDCVPYFQLQFQLGSFKLKLQRCYIIVYFRAQKLYVPFLKKNQWQHAAGRVIASTRHLGPVFIASSRQMPDFIKMQCLKISIGQQFTVTNVKITAILYHPDSSEIISLSI